jgi:hypothetical protein
MEVANNAILVLTGIDAHWCNPGSVAELHGSNLDRGEQLGHLAPVSVLIRVMAVLQDINSLTWNYGRK